MNGDSKHTIAYLSTDDVDYLNEFAITYFKTKRGDKHKLKDRAKLKKVLDDVKSCESTNIYDKAVILIKGIAKCHAFVSGNRRTALFSTIVFLESNNINIGLPYDPNTSKTFIGIRENYYTDQEIKEWIKNGKIRPFKRNFA